jgi:type VI secretion system protein ImpM
MSERIEISGWYGKLPGAGDFASRGLSANAQQSVEAWVSSGLVQLRHRMPDWSYAFAQSPTWAAIMPRGVIGELPVLACVVPSADRVGRLYPLVALQSVGNWNDVDASLRQASSWYVSAAALVNTAQSNALSIEEFDDAFLNWRIDQRSIAPSGPSMSANSAGDDILAILRETQSNVITIDSPPRAASQNVQSSYDFSWPELKTLFDPNGSRSFWWTLGTDVSKRLGHEGKLTPHLFITLFTTAQRDPHAR